MYVQRNVILMSRDTVDRVREPLILACGKPAWRTDNRVVMGRTDPGKEVQRSLVFILCAGRLWVGLSMFVTLLQSRAVCLCQHMYVPGHSHTYLLGKAPVVVIRFSNPTMLRITAVDMMKPFRD